jgi:hypothetical protein
VLMTCQASPKLAGVRNKRCESSNTQQQAIAVRNTVSDLFLYAAVRGCRLFMHGGSPG